MTERECCKECGRPFWPALRLTGLSQEIYEYMSKQMQATTDQIVEHIYRNHADGGPLNARKVVHVTIYNLNKKLRTAYGVQIAGKLGRHGYYAMEEV